MDQIEIVVLCNEWAAKSLTLDEFGSCRYFLSIFKKIHTCVSIKNTERREKRSILICCFQFFQCPKMIIPIIWYIIFFDIWISHHFLSALIWFHKNNIRMRRQSKQMCLARLQTGAGMFHDLIWDLGTALSNPLNLFTSFVSENSQIFGHKQINRRNVISIVVSIHQTSRLRRTVRWNTTNNYIKYVR